MTMCACHIQKECRYPYVCITLAPIFQSSENNALQSRNHHRKHCVMPETLGLITLLSPVFPVFFLQAAQPGSASVVGYRWRSPDETVSLPFSDSRTDLLKLFADYDLCITGPVIKCLESSDKSESVSLLAEVCRVFARMSPTQKESILLRLRERGHHTMMCGDGEIKLLPCIIFGRPWAQGWGQHSIVS